MVKVDVLCKQLSKICKLQFFHFPNRVTARLHKKIHINFKISFLRDCLLMTVVALLFAFDGFLFGSR